MNAVVSVLLLAVGPLYAQDPLPSWNDTAPKKAIVAFIEKVTKEGSPDFVPLAERIATFDNDGTLWAEQPMYFQFAFASGVVLRADIPISKYYHYDDLNQPATAAQVSARASD